MGNWNNLDYQSLYHGESTSAKGMFGLKILVAGTNMPDLKSAGIVEAVYNAARLVSEEVQAATYAADPDEQRRATVQRLELLSLFGDHSIFAEPIPNGYCCLHCCRHLPWFVVTTRVGRFKIGWRKRVISIDWSETVGTALSDDLFEKEDVTKQAKTIHAWDLDKAREYIHAIMASAKVEV